jgi:hypothetical protein
MTFVRPAKRPCSASWQSSQNNTSYETSFASVSSCSNSFGDYRLDLASLLASVPPCSRHSSLSALFSSQIAASSTCTSALCCGSNTFSFVCHLSQSEHIPISAGSSSPAFSVPHFVRIVSTSHLLTKTFLCLSSRFQTHAPVSANRDVHLAPLTLNCVLSDIFASRLTL